MSLVFLFQLLIALEIFAGITAALIWVEWRIFKMADFTALNAEVTKLEAVVPNLQTDYTNFTAEIGALREEQSSLQASVDAATARLVAVNAALKTLDESKPSIPPPTPPGA